MTRERHLLAIFKSFDELRIDSSLAKLVSPNAIFDFRHYGYTVRVHETPSAVIMRLTINFELLEYRRLGDPDLTRS